ncbi:avidin-like [Patagioenas fasciata]|uniref:avidin-like n=1 Tax=Patagioenas fasciata TaxID=372321 RepID=UPI003A993EB5
MPPAALVAIKSRGRRQTADTYEEHIPVFSSCLSAAEMVQVIPFLLLLSLALVVPGFSATKCELTGEWVNDLGSHMTIGPVDKEGKFDGSYETAVKDTTSNIYCSPLVGFQHTCKENFAFGFTVNWKSSDPAINSITVFTGQCFVDDAGKETLKTMWLLRSGVGNIKDDWKATKVGTNTFTRRYSQEQSGIVGDCKAHRSTCNAQCISCHPTCF